MKRKASWILVAVVCMCLTGCTSQWHGENNRSTQTFNILSKVTNVTDPKAVLPEDAKTGAFATVNGQRFVMTLFGWQKADPVMQTLEEAHRKG